VVGSPVEPVRRTFLHENEKNGLSNIIFRIYMTYLLNTKIQYGIEIVLILFFIFLLFSSWKFSTKNTYESFSGQPQNPPVIPLNIFQTWESKDLPPNMEKCIRQIKEENPEFNHYLYGDVECEQFIKDNFNEKVLNAYKKLIPGAYKADLWRCCVLYAYGGIYLDAKMIPLNGFRFIELTDKEYFVRDLVSSGKGVWNGLIVSKPQNPILKEAIRRIVENVENKFYGTSWLEPTGPILFKRIMSETEIDNLEYEVMLSGGNGVLITKNADPSQAILKYDKEAYSEQDNFKKKKRYTVLWAERNIYLE
jgi:mannosyltransferase OCH1-like enzyme